VVTVIIGVIAVLVAVYMAENKLIFWFVLFSWSGLGAAFGPVVLALLYDQRTTGAGVVAGMLGGFLTSVVWVQYFKAGAYGLYEAIPGFIVAAVATVVVSRLSAR
jgi:sodium/proline symporter